MKTTKKKTRNPHKDTIIQAHGELNNANSREDYSTLTGTPLDRQHPIGISLHCWCCWRRVSERTERERALPIFEMRQVQDHLHSRQNVLSFMLRRDQRECSAREAGVCLQLHDRKPNKNRRTNRRAIDCGSNQV